MSSTLSSSNDLTLFDNIEEHDLPDCKDFKTCPAIQRLLSSLRYYKSLQLQQNKDHREIFANFIKEVYKHSILNQDFHHFQKRHEHQLHEISEYAIENGICKDCNVNTCDHASRHYRVENIKTINLNLDPSLTVYIDTLDSFHFYLLHLHQVGLRFIDSTPDDANATQYDEAYDAEFARVRDNILSTKDSSNRFNRISAGHKFKLKTEEEHKGNITYLDSMVDDLLQKNVNEDIIMKLINYLKQEQYDTKSMDIDLQIANGNIAKYMANDNKCLKAIIGKFNESRGKI